MTLVIVIIVGLLGTLLFGWLAYRHWIPYVPRAEEPTQTTVAVQPVPLPVPSTILGRRDHRRCFLWPVVVLLLVAIGIGAYGYFEHLFHTRETVVTPPRLLPTADTTFVIVATPIKPVEVIMPPDWHIVWWGNTSRFESHAIWRGKDKIRVFTTRPGVGSAEIKIHRYHDPDPNWWRRQ